MSNSKMLKSSLCLGEESRRVVQALSKNWTNTNLKSLTQIFVDIYELKGIFPLVVPISSKLCHVKNFRQVMTEPEYYPLEYVGFAI